MFIKRKGGKKIQILTENSSHHTQNHLMLFKVFPSGRVKVMSFFLYRFRTFVLLTQLTLQVQRKFKNSVIFALLRDQTMCMELINYYWGLTHVYLFLNNQPFFIFIKNKTEYKSLSYFLWTKLQQESRYLSIQQILIHLKSASIIIKFPYKMHI